MDSVSNPPIPRKRSAQASLGQVVLGFELIVVGLAALTIFGLGALPPLVALGGGALSAAALIDWHFGSMIGRCHAFS